MPDQTDQTADVDPRDIRIKELEAQLAAARSDSDDLRAEINQLDEHVDEISTGYEARIQKLTESLKRTEVSGIGTDFVQLGGRQHPIVKTVRANTTFDEVKKGNVDEGSTLVVIAAPH